MAMSHKKRVEAARKARDKASAAIFGRATDPNHTFGTILEYAPKKLVRAYTDASVRLYRVESDAVDAGKAYRASFGMLAWYR